MFSGKKSCNYLLEIPIDLIFLGHHSSYSTNHYPLVPQPEDQTIESFRNWFYLFLIPFSPKNLEKHKIFDIF